MRPSPPATNLLFHRQRPITPLASVVALLPRHQVHTFKIISAGTGRLLTVIQPAGFERFFEVVAERRLGDEDMDEITTIAAEFGLEIVGPPPA
jgi:hypothetical protein